MLARMHRSMKDKDQGFTLIELLVVMIIIGILAAIAIPVFLNQRQKAVDSSTKSDLKTVANDVETYFVDNSEYSTMVAANFSGKLSKGAHLTYQAVTNESGYCIKGYTDGGSSSSTTFFWYDSKVGGLQSGAATATVPAGGSCAGTLSAAVVLTGP